MSAHTPTPWAVDDRPNDQVCNILDADGGVVAFVEDGFYKDGQGWIRRGLLEEDAAHIVRCVNSHDALITALRRIECEPENCDGPEDGVACARLIAIAALAAAEAP